MASSSASDAGKPPPEDLSEEGANKIIGEIESNTEAMAELYDKINILQVKNENLMNEAKRMATLEPELTRMRSQISNSEISMLH